MRAEDVAKYLEYANPDTDIVVVTRKQWEEVMEIVKTYKKVKILLDKIKFCMK